MQLCFVRWKQVKTNECETVIWKRRRFFEDWNLFHPMKNPKVLIVQYNHMAKGKATLTKTVKNECCCWVAIAQSVKRLLGLTLWGNGGTIGIGFKPHQCLLKVHGRKWLGCHAGHRAGVTPLGEYQGTCNT